MPRYNTQVITASSLEPVSISDTADHLRVAQSTEHPYIAGLISAARAWVEQYTGRTLMPTTLEAQYDNWPGNRQILIPLPPVTSVTSLKYIDKDGTENTVDSGDYLVDTVPAPGVLRLDYDASWPTATLQPGMPIRIRYVAGYVDRYRVPAPIKQAIYLLVGDMYENRETVVVSPGMTVAKLDTAYALLANYRVGMRGYAIG